MTGRIAGFGPLIGNSQHRFGPFRPAAPEAVPAMLRADHSAARSLVVNKLGVLALLIPDISNPFFPLLARGAEAAAREAGFTVILGNSDEDCEEELAYVRAICSLRVDGALVR